MNGHQHVDHEMIKKGSVLIYFIKMYLDFYYIKLFNSHANYSYIIVRLISFRICLHLADILHDFHSFVNSAEYGMLVI